MNRLALIACALVCASPAFAADKRVYKIDSLIASARNGVITVQAKGAVQTGGWKNAKLRVTHSDAHAVTVEFSATPPPPGMTVIEALVPVEAEAKIKSRAPAVKVSAEVNEMTAQVLK